MLFYARDFYIILYIPNAINKAARSVHFCNKLRIEKAISRRRFIETTSIGATSIIGVVTIPS